MSKYSKIIYSFIIAVLVTVSIAVWKGIGSFLFAWIFHFMIMMLTLSIMQTVMPNLTSSYFTIRNWERNGSIYKLFGVNLYRKILIWVGWEGLNKKQNPVKKTVASLQQLEQLTRQSEFSHLVIFIIVCLLSVCITIYESFSASFWLLFLNIPLHIYPIILQRYNRPRFQKCLKLLQTKPN